MAKTLMIQGTMSNAGKSLLVCGLCRIFKQDGYRVAPFKSQNMALNSFVTKDGLEMGRAQVMQAEAAGCEPDASMNPILLKPTDNESSQVIVMGKPVGNMKAVDYFKFKTSLIPDIKKSFKDLSDKNDIIVIEGAGSPAEINLKENDIVNMGMAKMADAPVIIVGDIDRGGVFAQLLGTMLLLEPDEQERVKGFVMNKFRGDAGLLTPGIEMLEEKAGVPVIGVVPYAELDLEDEDSLSERFLKKEKALTDIAVVRLPRISNFTDFDIFGQFKDVSVRYVQKKEDLKDADMIILPGTKNTVSDLMWLKETGLFDAIKNHAKEGVPVFGICGGYQMLGLSVKDPDGVEGSLVKDEVEGLGLLPVNTVIKGAKLTKQFAGNFTEATGLFKGLSGKPIEGYEIHMGSTVLSEGCGPTSKELTSSGTGFCKDNIYGTYVHGVFDKKEAAEEIIGALRNKKGLDIEDKNIEDQKDHKERQFDKLADILREHLDMDAIYEMMGISR